MKQASLFVSLWLALSATAHAQLFGSGIVFDPTQSGHALAQIREAEQLYTTANQTREQIIQGYNLARQMAQMPQNLHRRYAAEFSRWTTLSAANTYSNTSDWTSAANTGSPQLAINGHHQAGVELSAFPGTLWASLDPRTQDTVKAQYATADLTDGVSTSSLVTLGQVRSRSQALNQQIGNLESDSYSTDPGQQTQMAVLGKINAASVMQLRSQQDTNQILSEATLQQMLTTKERADQQKRALNQAIFFQQKFGDSMKKVTSGMTQSMQSISYADR
jgi:hypothetical protein